MPVAFLRQVLFFSGLLLVSSCSVREQLSEAGPISHDTWDSLLVQHVSPEGWVDYEGFIQDSNLLNTYLRRLSGHHPNREHWLPEEEMAYWINAYNAFTVKLVTDHYPVDGIKEIKPGIPFINTVWDIKFIRIEDRMYDLNNIEHGILRSRFDDARVHFVLNCASVSCPVLLNEAYDPARLDQQLDEAGRLFLSTPSRNRIENPDEIFVSSIFKWYRRDFVKEDQSLIDFLNRFSPVQINTDAKVKYLEYDWRLNEPRSPD